MEEEQPSPKQLLEEWYGEEGENKERRDLECGQSGKEEQQLPGGLGANLPGGFESVYILFKGSLFEETSYGIQELLATEGVVAYVSSMTEDYVWEAGMLDPSALFILLGWIHDFPVKPLRFKYVLIQMEQTQSNWFIQAPYQKAMRDALAIWDYSPVAVQLEREAGLYAFEIGMPIDSAYLSVPYAFTDVSKPVPDELRVIDVLWYGVNTERREEFFQLMQATCKEHGYGTVYRHVNLYGSGRDEVVTLSKVVLNIHAFCDYLQLEVHRLHYLLSMGKVVVSERGDDPELEKLYEGAVVFSDLEDMPRIAGDLIQNSTWRWEIEGKARALAEKLQGEGSTLVQAWRSTMELAGYVDEHGVFPNGRAAQGQQESEEDSRIVVLPSLELKREDFTHLSQLKQRLTSGH